MGFISSIKRFGGHIGRGTRFVVKSIASGTRSTGHLAKTFAADAAHGFIQGGVIIGDVVGNKVAPAIRDAVQKSLPYQVITGDYRGMMSNPIFWLGASAVLLMAYNASR